MPNLIADMGLTLTSLVAIVAHVFFRLAYFFYVGTRLKEAQVNRPQSTAERYNKWLRFKKRASFILNADGLSLAAVAILNADTLGETSESLYFRITGAVLIGIGLAVKISAYRATGVKGYYWYNFFCSSEEREYVARGPYRYLNNPMYGLGYAHAVGIPLVLRSSWGLVLALFDWVVIWVFYFAFERSHTRHYNKGRPVTNAKEKRFSSRGQVEME